MQRKVFLWVLGVLADEGLLKGKTVGVDATTLEANAAMRFLCDSALGAPVARSELLLHIVGDASRVRWQCWQKSK